MTHSGEAKADTAARPTRARKPAPPNADMAWVAARLLLGAELRRHAGIGTPPWWALHASGDRPRRLDDRTVSGLEARGAVTRDDGRSDAVRSTVLVLSEAGRELAATLPPADPDYQTPHERRRGKRDEVWKARDAVWETKQGASSDD